MKNLKYIFLSAVLFGFTACSEDDDSSSMEQILPELSAGSADFSNFVSLGNSLTAGFTDNALFIAGQQNSFPNILSQQFALVGGGNFTQPLMSDNIGGMTLGGMRILQPRLVFGGAGPVPLESVVGPVTPGTELSTPISGPFNNLGVPGALSFHLLAPGYGNLANFPAAANPYAVRIAGSTDATILELAMAQSPTFFSLWIGNNDVLGYATSGGSTGTLTDQGTFDAAYNGLVATLTSGNAQGVIANIPDVTSIPYFTTVPYNPLDPSDPAFGSQVGTLNGIFSQLNQVFQFLGVPERSIVFSPNQPSPVVILDDSLPNLSNEITGVFLASPTFPDFLASFGLPPQAAPQVAGLLGFVYGQARQATEDDLLVLPSATVIGTVNEDFAAFLGSQGLPPQLAGQFAVNGVSLPLEDQWTLTTSEQMEVATATSGFNATIEAAANTAGLALVDANALLEQLANGGIASGSFVLDGSLVFGGAFSLDGVHPTARGYALIANEFMKAIDATYGSNFEASGNLVNVGEYPTNYNPALQ